jgi:hypothetical protein
MFKLLLRLAVLRMVTRLSTAAITAAKGRKNKYVALLVSLVAARLAGSQLKGR